MSRENVEIVGRLIDAFGRRDWQSFMALVDPDIEGHDRPEAGLGTFHGHDGDVEERIAQVLRLRGGKVCYARIYTNRREALEAVGLRE